MAKLLKVKAGDKIVYADCKANANLTKDHGIVIGKIYTVEKDWAGDPCVEREDGSRCWAGLISSWTAVGKATKIVSE